MFERTHEPAVGLFIFFFLVHWTDIYFAFPIPTNPMMLHRITSIFFTSIKRCYALSSKRNHDPTDSCKRFFHLENMSYWFFSTLFCLKYSTKSIKPRKSRKYAIVCLSKKSMLIYCMFLTGFDRCKKTMEQIALEGPVSLMKISSIIGLD